MAKYFKKVSPESCGVDSLNILSFIDSMDLNSELRETHGFMLLRHGKLLTEGYFSPYNEDTPHMLFSASKTFTQLAIGFMVKEGKLSLDDCVFDYFSDVLPKDITDVNKTIKIKDMLIMATGHSGHPIHQAGDWQNAKDLVEDFFKTECSTQPGTEFQYDNIASFVLSVLVSKKTGKNIIEYLKPRFLDVLGINVHYCATNSENVCLGYSGMRITLEDVAKVGQFFLSKGKWEDKQLLPQEWCEEAMRKHQDCDGAMGEDWTSGYGYHMWRGRYNTARLCGAFGQMCVIAPDYDMVFAIFSGCNYNKLEFILENFYNNIMLKTSDVPLEENAVGNVKLENRIEKLKLQDRFEPVLPVAEELNGKTFSFDKCGRYNKIKLDFDDESCLVTLLGEGEIKFKAGLHRVEKTYIEDGGFVAVDFIDHGEYHASAYFEKDGTFKISARIHTTPTIVKIDVFPDETVKIYTIRGSIE